MNLVVYPAHGYACGYGYCHGAGSESLCIHQTALCLRGWANYHSHVVAKKIFNQLDSAVWKMLWRWLVRRHPRKTRQLCDISDQGRCQPSRPRMGWVLRAKECLSPPKGRAKLYRVWVYSKAGRCCACLKPVTKDTPWHSRHVVKLSHGGTDAAANLEIYHLRCPKDVQFANVDDYNRVPNGALAEKA